MDIEKTPEVLIGESDPKVPSFETMLDITCERLREKHIQYSIRRIGEMEQELARLEKELDDFLCLKNQSI
jgi:hypothetical protein